MSNKVGNGELRHMKIIRYFEQEREIVWQHKLLVLFKEVERLVKKKNDVSSQNLQISN